MLKYYKIFSSTSISLNKTKYFLALNLSKNWKLLSEIRNSSKADFHITLNMKSYVQLIFLF